MGHRVLESMGIAQRTELFFLFVTQCYDPSLYILNSFCRPTVGLKFRLDLHTRMQLPGIIT